MKHNVFLYLGSFLILISCSKMHMNVNSSGLVSLPVPLSVLLPQSGIYYEGDQLQFSFVFLEDVTVSGTPQVSLTIGGTPGVATYVSGSGSKTLVFRHTVAASVAGQGPLLVPAIDLNGGSIKNSSNEDMPLTFTVPSTSSIFVDGRNLSVSMDLPERIESKVAEDRHELTVTINPAPLVDLTIPVRLRGSAIFNSDYVLDSPFVTIRAGQTSAQFGYNIKNDLDTVTSKYFSVTLDRPTAKSNILLGENTSTRVSILDDDGTPKDRWKKISAGVQHSCGITTSNVLKCWGINDVGQLGNGSTVSSHIPVVVESGTSFIDVAVGSAHTCAITSVNALKCWGSNIDGQVGDTTTVPKNAPVHISNLVQYKSVSSYHHHSCAVTTGNYLRCWGRNTNFQLGDTTSVTKRSPITIDPTVFYSSVSVGPDHSCAITTGNILKCWGTNFTHGAIGTGGSGSTFSTPAEVDPGVLYRYVRAGDIHTCGITINDDLKCWGANSYGQLGIGSATPIRSYVPVAVDPGVKYESIDGGQMSTCGITKTNALKCWGSNDEGQLGIGNITPRIYGGVVVDATQSYKQVEISQRHACAITDTNVLKCWGSHRYGTAGEIYETALPLAVPAQDYKNIQIGSNRSCGISNSNELYCWGKNENGELGDGTTLYRSTSVVIDPGVFYRAVAVGTSHICGITMANELKCWGENTLGQIGDGTTVNQKFPKNIDPGTSYKHLTISENHSCAITTSDVLKCWGNNSSSQLGTGDAINVATPIVIDTGVSYKDVATTPTATCGVTADGKLKCWGANNNRQLADGTTTPRVSPLVSDVGVNYESVSMSADSGCGITVGKTLRCWGKRQDVLGLYNSPTDLDGGTQYKDIVVGASHSCGISSTDALKCWGSTGSGQVGNGTSGVMVPNVATPTIIDPGITYKTITLAALKSCGITLSGVTKCWGSLYDNIELSGTSNNLYPKATNSY